MNIVEETLKRLQLTGLRDRILDTDTAFDIAHGVWLPDNDELLPKPKNDARRNAWDRVKRQMQTLGPRVMETKRNAILGDVTWGGDSPKTDDALAKLDLRRLASRLLNPYMVTGITAGIAHTIPGDPTPRITRLGGHIEPYTHPDDVDTVTGLLQAWQNVHETDEPALVAAKGYSDRSSRRTITTWNVRIIDFEDPENTVWRLWENLYDPTQLGRPPNEIVEHAPTPRFAIRQFTSDGLVLGELQTALPQIKALWATEARLTLSEELVAFPMGGAFGDIDTKGLAVGPAEVVTGGKDARWEWLKPGDLTELREQRRLRMERIREDMSLPGGFLANDSPSGEALKEANVRFHQNSGGYALDISRLLTDLVEDFAKLAGTNPVEVSISPSKSYDPAARIKSITDLYQAGLLPLSVAAVEIQPFFPSWSDKELDKWLKERSSGG